MDWTTAFVCEESGGDCDSEHSAADFKRTRWLVFFKEGNLNWLMLIIAAVECDWSEFPTSMGSQPF